MQAKMLDGKVAIVSGASYGMGFSMAELFAKEGAKVVMTARGKEKLDVADLPKINPLHLKSTLEKITDFMNNIPAVPAAYPERWENR